MKIYLSKKAIISIYEFMENYLGVKYEEKDKLTHKNMTLYLKKLNIQYPRIVAFRNVKKYCLLNGSQIAVKDDVSKVLIYNNPRMTIKELHKELINNQNEDTKEGKQKIIKKIKNM